MSAGNDPTYASLIKFLNKKIALLNHFQLLRFNLHYLPKISTTPPQSSQGRPKVLRLLKLIVTLQLRTTYLIAMHATNNTCW